VPVPKSQADIADLTPTVIGVGEWAEGMANDGKWLWVSESGQRTIAKVDFAKGTVVKRAKVGRLPTDLIADSSGKVFGLIATDKVIKTIDKNGRVRRLSRLGKCPSRMVRDGRYIWALTEPACGSVSSRVMRIDTRNGRKKKF
jgi:sugar lactone lactonase YvrE